MSTTIKQIRRFQCRGPFFRGAPAGKGRNSRVGGGASGVRRLSGMFNAEASRGRQGDAAGGRVQLGE